MFVAYNICHIMMFVAYDVFECVAVSNEVTNTVQQEVKLFAEWYIKG